jgi:hypothetical protein
MNDNYNSGRKIYNIGGHGTVNQSTLNARLMDGIDLNDSLNGRRFDNHFDTSHDNLENINHNSSRYSTGGGIADIAHSMIKRSGTE